jgi:cytochrome c-type biogenesis protein CcmH
VALGFRFSSAFIGVYRRLTNVSPILDMGFRLIVLILLLNLGGIAHAKEAVPAAEDPVVERRAMALAEQMRCLVCQNQSLADSNAELAIDLKNQIRDQMKQGRSDRDIVDYMVARYGDFVLYSPPLKATTLMLWFGPLMLLAIGLAVLFYRLARRRKTVEVELTDAERVRAARLLEEGSETEAR